ncbi:MAG: Ig-like domain-containing protein [Anaerovoracaceae bacterium]|jgi:hypothetical protein
MKKRILILSLLCTLLAALSLSLPLHFAAADGGDGSGGGSGSGQGKNRDIPLTLAASTPEDGSVNVARDVIIELDFNKNICNVKVLENNKTCFHLTRTDNDEVIPLTVTVPDDQVQRTYKREVFLKPQKKLRAKTEYRIAVDSTLRAKNGTTIDNAHRVTFRTGTKTGAETPETLKKLGMNKQTFTSARAETKASVPHSQEKRLDADNRGGLSTQALAALAAAVLIAVIAGAVLLSRRRRPRPPQQ